MHVRSGSAGPSVQQTPGEQATAGAHGMTPRFDPVLVGSVAGERLEAGGSVRLPWVGPILAVVVYDVACLVIAASLAGATSGYGPAELAAGAAWVIAFLAFGLYAPERLTGLAEARRTIAAVAVGVCALALTAPTTPRMVAGLVGCALVIELAGRGALRFARNRRSLVQGPTRRAMLVCGPNETDALTARMGRRFRVVGRIDPSSAVAGGFGEDVDARVDNVDVLVVSANSVSRETARRILRIGRQQRVEVCFLTDLPALFDGGYRVECLGDGLATTVSPPAFLRVRGAVKRVADAVIAGTLLVLSAPVMAAIAVAICRTTRGPALYRQLRVTKDGRVFSMVKFRTMTDERTPAAVVKQALRAEPDVVDARQAFFKMPANDPRITKVGKLLRRYSLDELPQLWNVVRGDMSLVGPRPLPLEQVTADRDLLEPRLAVMGGLSGWWQVNGRSDTDADAAVDLDMYYIDNWSLSLDCYILLRTFGAVFSGRGAF